VIYGLTSISNNVIILLIKEGNMDVSNNYSAPQNDIKRKRFIRIVESRVNKIFYNLDNLSKCSNKRNYEYSEEDVRRIFREIERKVKETRLQFQDGARNKGKFKL
jgi:hypothetical protein